MNLTELDNLTAKVNNRIARTHRLFRWPAPDVLLSSGEVAMVLRAMLDEYDTDTPVIIREGVLRRVGGGQEDYTP